MMVMGRWQPEGKGAEAERALRPARPTIRHWITPDGPFTPEAGRYHLYVALSCPWSHRALLARAILGLEDAIGTSHARPVPGPEGWTFDAVGRFSDPCLGVAALHEVYARQRPPYSGPASLPVLWDRDSGRIVSNDSADILRMLGAFGRGPDLAPAGLGPEIEAWNALIQPAVNLGVYRAGFARSQAAHDEAVSELFAALDRIDAHLAGNAWLAGDALSEADLRLFPTLVRFDAVYHYLFKCNLRRLTDYPSLWRAARRMLQMPGVAGTVDIELCKQAYFGALAGLNPSGIVPRGPLIDWSPDPA